MEKHSSSSATWALLTFCTEQLSKTFQIINHLLLKSKFFIANEISLEGPVPEWCILVQQHTIAEKQSASQTLCDSCAGLCPIYSWQEIP